MDKLTLCERLNVRPYGTFWVTELHIFDWGAEIMLDCQYDPGAPDALVAFRLILRDCRDLNWRVYAHLKHPEDTTLPATLLVNIRLGHDQHHKPFNLLTDAFGLTVLYGALAIERSEAHP
jgi:hypothetical protein